VAAADASLRSVARRRFFTCALGRSAVRALGFGIGADTRFERVATVTVEPD